MGCKFLALSIPTSRSPMGSFLRCFDEGWKSLLKWVDSSNTWYPPSLQSRRWILLANLILSFLSPSPSANEGLRRLNHRESGSLVSILIGMSLIEIIILPKISSLPGPTFSSTVTIKNSSKGSDATNMSSSFHTGFTVGIEEGFVGRSWFPSWTRTWVTGGRPLSEGTKS
uniref:Uncharacterized protein n=1 Tax=Opuntia streptacantha TaxID=393608 RepID=A0A7C9E7G2_OPUST